MEPVSIEGAATRLRRSEVVIRKWISRYRARKVGTVGGLLYVDYADLATIEACITQRRPVPPTPEGRDALRASYATAA